MVTKRHRCSDIVNFWSLVKTDCKLEIQMYADSFKKQPLIILGRKSALPCEENTLGIVEIERGSLERFNNAVKRQILTDPAFAVNLLRLMSNSLRELIDCSLKLEGLVRNNEFKKAPIAMVYDQITTYMAFKELVYSFPYSYLEEIIAETVPKNLAMRIYNDIQLPKSLPHYMIFSYSLLDLAEKTIIDEKRYAENSKKFMQEFAFLSNTGIEPSPYEDISNLKREIDFILRKYKHSIRELQLEKETISKSILRAHVRRRIATDYLIDCCDGKCQNRVLLTYLVDLASEIVDMEEVKHYWQIRTLRNFRHIIDHFRMSRRFVTIQDLLSAIKD